MLADNPYTFKVVVRDRYDDRVPDFYRTIPIRDGPVPIADQLRRELPYWHPANPVLLDLPPGTGKTTFVYRGLIPAALARGENLLLVSNRIALSLQQKRAIMDLLDDPRRKLLTDEGIRQTEDFGPVRVITYHRLACLLRNQSAVPWIANLAYVVFDEAHFFAADAMFNADVDYCLRLACERFCRATRVYMTGTSWDILEPLAEAETRFYHRPLGAEWRSFREGVRYTVPFDYSRYNLHFFTELSDLLPVIEERSDEKWIIFVDSKESGRRFCKKLADRAMYLDADSKGSEEWNEVVADKQFPSQVLVTTAALDNGIDIIDPTVKNVAVIADNRTSLIQMIGRKRLAANEHVAIWGCDLPRTVIANRYQKYRSWLAWYDRLDKCVTTDHYQTLAQQLWREEDPALRKLFHLAHGKLFPNELARYVLHRRCLLFSRILSGETTFRREVQKWFGLDPDVTSAVTRLQCFYQEHGERPLHEEQQTALRTLVNACYAENGYMDPQRKRASTLRNRALTHRLAKIGLPYTIEGEKGAWVLSKTDADEQTDNTDGAEGSGFHD